VTDHYADETCRWWHLSRPSPELLAARVDGVQISAPQALLVAGIELL